MEVTVIRVIFGYAIGILVSFVLGSIAGTQVVLASVQAMGLEVSWAARIEVSRADLLGLSATLLPIMALALAAGWGLYDGGDISHALRPRYPCLRFGRCWLYPRFAPLTGPHSGCGCLCPDEIFGWSSVAGDRRCSRRMVLRLHQVPVE